MTVELVINCFERTYREVLSEGYVEAIAAQNKYPFAQRTVLINNVDDPARARELARERVDEGEIDRFLFVADRLKDALQRTGLTRDDLEPTPYFMDFLLVAACLDGPEYLLHWDADCRLVEPVDWVTPSLELMERDPRVLVANPNWEIPNLDEFTLENDGRFALAHGFSDQVFLARKEDLAAPIYKQRCIAKWRYPFPYIYEARIDAYQRHNNRLRATYRDAMYVHPVAMGTSWPGVSRRERLSLKVKHGVIDVLRKLPRRPRHIRGL
jgi:hypothetical protein